MDAACFNIADTFSTIVHFSKRFADTLCKVLQACYRKYCLSHNKQIGLVF